MSLRELIELSARLFEGSGVAVMVVGALLALVRAWLERGEAARVSAFQRFRHRVGQSILLGLELLVAADIIRTVSERPALREVLVLGVIVLIRTFLSFTLEVELEGRWPWERARQEPRREDAGEPPPAPPGS